MHDEPQWMVTKHQQLSALLDSGIALVRESRPHLSRQQIRINMFTECGEIQISYCLARTKHSVLETLCQEWLDAAFAMDMSQTIPPDKTYRPRISYHACITNRIAAVAHVQDKSKQSDD
jgi:hypothetical protein